MQENPMRRSMQLELQVALELYSALTRHLLMVVLGLELVVSAELVAESLSITHGMIFLALPEALAQGNSEKSPAHSFSHFCRRTRFLNRGWLH